MVPQIPVSLGISLELPSPLPYPIKLPHLLSVTPLPCPHPSIPLIRIQAWETPATSTFPTITFLLIFVFISNSRSNTLREIHPLSQVKTERERRAVGHGEVNKKQVREIGKSGGQRSKGQSKKNRHERTQRGEDLQTAERSKAGRRRDTSDERTLRLGLLPSSLPLYLLLGSV